MADKPPDACARRRFDLPDTKRYEAQLSMMCCQELPSGEWLRFTGQIFRLLHTSLPFDAHNEGDPLELSGSYLVWEN